MVAKPTDKVILDIRIIFEKTILVAENFPKDLIKKYGKHSISNNEGTRYPSPACKFLNIDHHLHLSYVKSIIEKSLFNISMIEQNAFMSIFLIEKKSVNYNTSEIGSIYLLTIIIRE